MNEQNAKLEAIRQRCRKSEKVIGVLQIIALIGLIGALIGAICCLVWKDAINEEMVKQLADGRITVETFQISGGLLNFKIDYDGFFRSGDYATPAAINCAIAVAVMLASFYLLSIFKKIFRDLTQEDNPFADAVLSGLKKCFIAASVVMIVFVGVGPGAIGALLFWCIYSVFEYGKLLQTEVDETL